MQNCSVVEMRCGAIHFFRCFVACLISLSTIMISAIMVSVELRWPKSAEIAASNRASLSETAARSRFSRSSRAQASGAGAVRDSSNRRERHLAGRAAPGFSAAVPWRSLRASWAQSSAFARFLARAVPSSSILAQKPRFGRHKILKNAPLAFPKQACVDTYASHPMASARVAFSGSLRTGSIGADQRWPASFRLRLFERRATV